MTDTPTAPLADRVLLLEGISPSAVQVLEGAGFTSVETRATALSGAPLAAAVDGVRLLGIRSRTRVTAELIARTPRLIAIGCFSVGTNQVDLAAARAAGIPVFNAPFSNTRSVAELTIAEIVMLFRRVFARSTAAHAGRWEKSARDSVEIRGKTLGIVGYGNIGTQLAVLAEAMGMRVIFHDHTDKLQHGNVTPAASLEALLAEADVVSLHLPETEQTRGLIGAAEIAAMKKGAFLINNARGSLVDLEALARALRDGHLRGAAVDVFPVEPASNDEAFASPLQGIENVILTPHVGGSTQEAQERIGAEVARKFVEYATVGSTTGAVNFPQVQLPTTRGVTRFLQVQRNLPGQLRQLNDIFARRAVNIAAQHYQTDGEIGYVVLDATDAGPAAAEMLAEIRALDGTIRARTLG